MPRREKQQATARVKHEWLRRVEAEYRSAVLTQHLTLWLLQIGTSPDLVSLGLRIVKDELAHAKLSHDTYVAAGGTKAPALDRDTLALARHPSDPLESDVARVCLDVFCLGETVAVRLFKELREPCEVPVARRALDRILKDEVRHRDFGWVLLSCLLEGPSGALVRAVVSRELASSFTRIRQTYAPVAKERSAPTAMECCWGLMGAERYRTALEKAFEKDYSPRFAALGFDAPRAWNSSSP